MNGASILGGALLPGLAGNSHCLLMGSGICAALGIATAKGADGRPRPGLPSAINSGVSPCQHWPG